MKLVALKIRCNYFEFEESFFDDFMYLNGITDLNVSLLPLAARDWHRRRAFLLDLLAYWVCLSLCFTYSIF